MKYSNILLSGLMLLSVSLYGQTKPEETEVWEPEPPVVNTMGEIPSDAIVLFSEEKGLSAWESTKGGEPGWIVEGDHFTVKPGTGMIRTRDSFGSIQLHIEWRAPEKVVGEGQGRGNSGVFLMGRYEVQVLDSYNNRTYSNGQAGSVYKQHIPLANATRPPGEWQVYDIVFIAPSFNSDGSLDTPARVTVFHNGVLLQHDVELKGPTEYIGQPVYKPHPDALPLELQDHSNPVSFRNIWIRKL
ncbi:3-keto-disaccharide hydrolase [Fulvivirga sedimenti]|uniref:DUF1080 domain-containing protein n=1 Tax=Fulvivirga sedimenti TaxID=2879465 RepID=A0A9X1HSQ3_9BACT|nr:DUF1080 domain-containing protein [Fulvivirga sedimenti]MCA6074915.1 DUF1080 domain-containing protein [Fulvivirga sedimenti]MCA6076092.1 DUF1080 domain-containing protein [Fulvivirga sedimenti]MCA6077220.1 DUF1080 domain-containing protein [Fulvivirga sedimenti]